MLRALSPSACSRRRTPRTKGKRLAIMRPPASFFERQRCSRNGRAGRAVRSRRERRTIWPDAGAAQEGSLLKRSRHCKTTRNDPRGRRQAAAKRRILSHTGRFRSRGVRKDVETWASHPLTGSTRSDTGKNQRGGSMPSTGCSRIGRSVQTLSSSIAIRTTSTIRSMMLQEPSTGFSQPSPRLSSSPCASRNSRQTARSLAAGVVIGLGSLADSGATSFGASRSRTGAPSRPEEERL